MNNKFFLPLFLAISIFCCSVKAQDISYSSEDRWLDIELDSKDDNKNSQIISSKKTLKYADLNEYLDLENRSLINAEKSVLWWSLRFYGRVFKMSS